jgi:flagellar protein FliO/FliZ
MCSRWQSKKWILPLLTTIVVLQSDHVIADDSFLPPKQAAIPTPAVVNDPHVQPATHNGPLRDHQLPPQPDLSPTKLSPPSESSKSATRSGPFSAILTVLGSLAIVLGLFAGMAWLMRRGLPTGGGRLPSGVVEVLGNAPLASRQQMHVLRFGGKLLLVCVSQNGVDTLSEIEDAVEIERLMNLCQKSRATAAAPFDQIFGKLMRSTPAEQTAASGGLAAMALRKKSAPAGEVGT